MEIKEYWDGGELTLSIEGNLVHNYARSLQLKVTAHVDKGKIKRLILDFKDCHYIDSYGIGVLVGIYKVLPESGAKFAVKNLSPKVRGGLEMVGLADMIEIL